MSGRVAGLHFITAEPSALLPGLQSVFAESCERQVPDENRKLALEQLSQEKIDRAQTPKKKAMMMLFKAVIMAEEKKPRAVVVLRSNVVSLYWDDHIRMDNLEKEACAYAEKLNVPTLAMSLYDDNNFVVYGVNGEKTCKGFYWFDEEDVEPVDAAELCCVLGMEALTDSVRCALSKPNGEEMADAFELATGLQLYLDAEACDKMGFERIVMDQFYLYCNNQS